MPQLLNQSSWLLGDCPDDWPRSRYSGVALRPGKMAVSIIVSWVELFGHAFIAFEWFADEVPGARTQQRRHEVYQLRAEPTEAERARGIADPGCLRLATWGTRPASVVREVNLQFFPLKDGNGRPLPAYYRSWLVDFADGWRAREAAAAAMARPPRYHYLELCGGQNCARWVLEIANLAGIDARHWFSALVAVPKRLVSPDQLVEEEREMWRRRRTA